jgi:hypothetical protein
MALESSPIVMYGATATAGFGNEDAACEAGTEGDQIISTGDDPVYLFVTNGVEGQRIYLSKKDKDNFSAPTDLWLNTDGFATGQVVYVTAQSMTSPFSAITTAGVYTLTLDDAFPGGGAFAVYIGLLNSTPTQAQPDECEATGPTVSDEYFGQTADAGVDNNISLIAEPGSRFSPPGNPVIKTALNAQFDYNRQQLAGGGVVQLPFSLTMAKGVFNLRLRQGAYKVIDGGPTGDVPFDSTTGPVDEG